MLMRQRVGRRARRPERSSSALGSGAPELGDPPLGLLLRAARLGDRRAWPRRRLPGRPAAHLRIRACNAKGGRSRRVPLWWDTGTLADLVAWRAEGAAQGARDADPFICSVQAHRRGQSLQSHALRRRFLTACKALGRERLRLLTIHHGRQMGEDVESLRAPAVPWATNPGGQPAIGCQMWRIAA